ncbi:MAG: FG-GAP-like repeat-containing protein [Actinomycetia bacterium]|nr:FG-GAP-like repeat-containing protein [Actinomycetes bacterium]
MTAHILCAGLLIGLTGVNTLTAEDGYISGIVADQNGNPLIGATVMLKDSPRGAMTDASGLYFIIRIPSGTYDVVAAMVGVTPDTVFDVRLAADDSLTINFTLGTERSWPAIPMIDTVYSSQITKTEWYHSDFRNYVGRSDSSQMFFSVDDIDWYSHAGELRLELKEHSIVDTSSDFFMLDSVDEGYIPGNISRNYEGSISSFGAFDFNENSVLEYVVVDKDNDRVMLFQRHMRDRDFTMLFTRFPQCRGEINVLYHRDYQMELISDEITSPYLVLLRDLNNDGLVDILVASREGNALTWLSRSEAEDSTVSWQMHVIADSTFLPRTIDIADINGDGHLDIVSVGDSIGYWLNTGFPYNRWVRGTIQPSFYEDIRIAALHKIRRIACRDLDGDGNCDLLASGEDGLSWFQNNGREPSSWSEYPVDGVRDGGYQVFETVDMNNDGVLNIVSMVSGQTKWWQNRFSSEGRLVSSILALRGIPLDAEIDWVSTASETLNLYGHTSVSFRIRSSFNPQEMGEWSEEILSPGDLMPYLNEHTRHIQYEVILRTEHPDVSPVLHELTVNYSYLDSVRAPQPRSSGMIMY